MVAKLFVPLIFRQRFGRAGAGVRREIQQPLPGGRPRLRGRHHRAKDNPEADLSRPGALVFQKAGEPLEEARQHAAVNVKQEIRAFKRRSTAI